MKFILTPIDSSEYIVKSYERGLPLPKKISSENC